MLFLFVLNVQNMHAELVCVVTARRMKWVLSIFFVNWRLRENHSALKDLELFLLRRYCGKKILLLRKHKDPCVKKTHTQKNILSFF